MYKQLIKVKDEYKIDKATMLDIAKELGGVTGGNHLRRMDDTKPEKAAKELKRKGIKLTWDDAMDVS